MSSKQQPHSSAVAIASRNRSRMNGSLMKRSARRRAPFASTSVSRTKRADTTSDGSMVDAPAARRHSLRQAFRNVFWGPTWGRAIAWNMSFVLQRHGKKHASQTAEPQTAFCRTVDMTLHSCCLEHGVTGTVTPDMWSARISLCLWLRHLANATGNIHIKESSARQELRKHLLLFLLMALGVNVTRSKSPKSNFDFWHPLEFLVISTVLNTVSTILWLTK